MHLLVNNTHVCNNNNIYIYNIVTDTILLWNQFSKKKKKKNIGSVYSFLCTRLFQIHPTVLVPMTFRRAFLSCTENISDLLLAVYLTSVFIHFTNSHFHNNTIILPCRSLFNFLRISLFFSYSSLYPLSFSRTHTHMHKMNFIVLASR